MENQFLFKGPSSTFMLLMSLHGEGQRFDSASLQGFKSEISRAPM